MKRGPQGPFLCYACLAKPIATMTQFSSVCVDELEEKSGLVYFIGNDQEGPVKIGFTSHRDPVKRLRQLQTASPYKLSVLGSISGTVATEKAIHVFLWHDNLQGEWFTRESALAMLQHLTTGYHSRTNKNDFFDKFFDIAITIGDGDLTDEEVLRGDPEPVTSIIARHILLDMLSRFRDCHAEKPLPFLTWLIEQSDRKDATGDLAKDACLDESFPSAGSVFDYINYLDGKSGSFTGPAITRTVVDAWIECQQAIFTSIK